MSVVGVPTMFQLVARYSLNVSVMFTHLLLLLFSVSVWLLSVVAMSLLQLNLILLVAINFGPR